jgi:hypothetical protein
VRSHMRTGLHPKFPANSENYREFFKFGHPKRLLVRENPRAAATSVSVPYRKITGKIITGSGRTLLKTGMFPKFRWREGRQRTTFNRPPKMGIDVPVVQIGLGWRSISALPTCGLDARLAR